MYIWINVLYNVKPGLMVTIVSLVEGVTRSCEKQLKYLGPWSFYLGGTFRIVII